MIYVDGEKSDVREGTAVAFQTTEGEWGVGVVKWGGKSGLRIRVSPIRQLHHIRRLVVLEGIDRRGPLCANCKTRPGTIQWDDMLALAYGFAPMWCELCATRAQLAHAEERAALIPEMRARIAELEANDV